MPVASGRVFCRRCLYPLKGLNQTYCPECGNLFDLGDPRTFKWRRRCSWRAAGYALLSPVVLCLVWILARVLYELAVPPI